MKEKEIFYRTTFYGEFISKILKIQEFDQILASFIGSSKSSYKYNEQIYIQANKSLFGYSIKVHSLENVGMANYPLEKKV